MIDFIPYVAIPFIMLFSKSYQEDILLSLLVLIPFFSIKIIYFYNTNKKMGKQLIKLNKTIVEERGTRTTIIIIITLLFYILVLTYYISNSFRLGLPWLMLIIFQLLYQRYSKKYLQKGLMENGVCTGSDLIRWDVIESFKWVIPKKEKDFGTLKMGYTKFYSYHVAYLNVLDEQKGEVNELFRKMTRVIKVCER